MYESSPRELFTRLSPISVESFVMRVSLSIVGLAPAMYPYQQPGVYPQMIPNDAKAPRGDLFGRLMKLKKFSDKQTVDKKGNYQRKLNYAGQLTPPYPPTQAMYAGFGQQQPAYGHFGSYCVPGPNYNCPQNIPCVASYPGYQCAPALHYHAPPVQQVTQPQYCYMMAANTI